LQFYNIIKSINSIFTLQLNDLALQTSAVLHFFVVFLHQLLVLRRQGFGLHVAQGIVVVNSGIANCSHLRESLGGSGEGLSVFVFFVEVLVLFFLLDRAVGVHHDVVV